MSGEYVVYGAAGSGSVAVEAALTLAGQPYRLVDHSFAAIMREGAVTGLNPLAQVPAVILPSGELMTESAAILMRLAEAHPRARLAPPPDDPARAAFLRWMVYVPAQIYALCWVLDEPSRLAADAAHEKVITERTPQRIADCWAMMEAQIEPGRYLLGERLSVLDIYVAVVSRWNPRRRRFYEVAPRMAEVVRRVDAEPRLADLWAERFPFRAGWEG